MEVEKMQLKFEHEDVGSMRKFIPAIYDSASNCLINFGLKTKQK